MQKTKMAIFKIGEDTYGMDIMDVNTIEKHMPMNRVTNSPQNMNGIMRLRGKVIPVYNLRRKFGLEEKRYDEDTRYMITISNGIMIAYEVDKMESIVTMEEENVMEVPALVKNENTTYIKCVTSVEDKLVIVLDHDNILSEEEQKVMKAIIKSIK